MLIIDLENPWLPPRILPHMSKWEVADVQWSPYLARESWIASTVSIIINGEQSNSLTRIELCTIVQSEGTHLES